jgi:hypothetical protein
MYDKKTPQETLHHIARKLPNQQVNTKSCILVCKEKIPGYFLTSNELFKAFQFSTLHIVLQSNKNTLWCLSCLFPTPPVQKLPSFCVSQDTIMNYHFHVFLRYWVPYFHFSIRNPSTSVYCNSNLAASTPTPPPKKKKYFNNKLFICYYSKETVSSKILYKINTQDMYYVLTKRRVFPNL